jgi:6-pyruvoyltetrahydropterin/6-carboxytetrahydropterin synthase
MAFEVTTQRTFSASHQLRLYDGSIEPLHGHNWVVRVTVVGEKLDSIGVVIDFHVLERLVDELILPMHNRHLNELAPFARDNPSAENVALHVGRGLKLPAGVRLGSVQVWETPENSAIYRA